MWVAEKPLERVAGAPRSNVGSDPGSFPWGEGARREYTHFHGSGACRPTRRIRAESPDPCTAGCRFDISHSLEHLSPSRDHFIRDLNIIPQKFEAFAEDFRKASGLLHLAVLALPRACAGGARACLMPSGRYCPYGYAVVFPPSRSTFCSISQPTITWFLAP